MQLLYFLVLIVSIKAAPKLPSALGQCYRDDPQLSQCILKNLENLKHFYSKGPIPELNIPALHPAVISSAIYNESDLYMELNNFRIWDIDNMNVDLLEFDEKHFNLDWSSPSLKTKSLYKLKGRIALLQFDNEGEATGNLTRPSYKYRVDFTTTTKHGEKYLTMKSSVLKMTLTKFDAYLTNIFKDDPELNDTANEILNSIQSIILNQFTPFLEIAVKSILDSVVGQVFKKYPLDVLLPEKPTFI